MGPKHTKMNETRVKIFSVKRSIKLKVEMKTQKKTDLMQKEGGEERQEECRKTDVGHSSCPSSPPSSCIRLVFFCVFISALFLLLFTALAPTLHAWIFYR